MKRHLTIFTCLMFITVSMKAQKVIPLYDGAIANAKPCDVQQKEFIDTTWNKDGILIVNGIVNPTITVFEAPKEKRNGTAVLICPGGGYRIVAAGHEGNDFAKALNEQGVTAFVLRYRLPNDACMENKSFVPLMDAQQALYIIRKNAKQYGIDENKVGIMGFSAGGHLASTAGTHFNDPVRKELANENLRPDFMILGYPVISFKDSIGHIGSRDALINKNPDQKLLHYFSNEEQVTGKTPPTFLIHASDDEAVKVANSILFYEALIKNKVPAELHVYEKGGHGFGMNNPTTQDKWFDRCINWMKANKWIF
jgi:acetyl esterase/lipase